MVEAFRESSVDSPTQVLSAGRSAGQLNGGTGAGAHSFFAAVGWASPGGAGDAGGRGAGQGADD